MASEQEPVRLTVPEGQERVLSLLRRLARSDVHVLLLEGGTGADRLALGLYWTALLNCRAHEGPCLVCPVCMQIQAQIFRDLYVFSGAGEAIKIDHVRALRPIMGQRPDNDATRIILIHEAQELTPSAANSLLKAMEEPLPKNVFVLTAPLRNWLLPTLVSRSFVITLNWAATRQAARDEVVDWHKALLEFWRTGQGLFEHTSKKGIFDRGLVRDILTGCQRELLVLMQGQGGQGVLAGYWRDRLDAEGLCAVDLIFHKAHQALGLHITPALVLDWVAVQIWGLVQGQGGMQ